MRRPDDVKTIRPIGRATPCDPRRERIADVSEAPQDSLLAPTGIGITPVLPAPEATAARGGRLTLLTLALGSFVIGTSELAGMDQATWRTGGRA